MGDHSQQMTNCMSDEDDDGQMDQQQHYTILPGREDGKIVQSVHQSDNRPAMENIVSWLRGIFATQLAAIVVICIWLLRAAVAHAATDANRIAYITSLLLA